MIYDCDASSVKKGKRKCDVIYPSNTEQLSGIVGKFIEH